MRLIFAGTPEFAKVQLQGLVEAGFNIVLVLTQPDRPAGRGQKLTPSPVKVYAQSQHIEVMQPTTLKDKAIENTLASYEPDLMIVSAYGMLLPQSILDLPHKGCWNVHASLLPRWRGAAPIQYALLSGDKETGISLMQMEAGLDSGPVLLIKKIPIEPEDTSATLFEKLTHLGADILKAGLASIEHLKPIKQDPHLVTLAPKIAKQQAQIDWSQSCESIERAIRAYQPSPCSYTFYQDLRIKLWAANILTKNQISSHTGVIQHVSHEGLNVSTHDGILQITHLQLPGKKPQTIGDILNASPDLFKAGQAFA